MRSDLTKSGSFLNKTRQQGALLVALLALIPLVSIESTQAQKGKAESDWYPQGYSLATWSGEVTAFDNKARTLTLTNGSGAKLETFVASIPDAPYQWMRDIRNDRVIDFPYDKKANAQSYLYVGQGFAATQLPDAGPGQLPASGRQQIKNPPADNVISDFKDFKGRRVTVYYTEREREVNGQKEKYNDVWRIRIDSKKK